MRSRIVLFATFVLTVLAVGILITLLTSYRPSSDVLIALFLAMMFLCLFGTIFFVLYTILSFRQNRGSAAVRRLCFNTGLAGASFFICLLALQGFRLISIPLAIGLLVATVIGWFVLERRPTGETMPRTKQ